VVNSYIFFIPTKLGRKEKSLALDNRTPPIIRTDKLHNPFGEID